MKAEAALMHSLAQLPADPNTHLRLWFYTAAVQIGVYLEAVGGAEAVERFPFLRAYIDEMRAFLPPIETLAALGAAAREGVRAWEAALPPAGDVWPLRRLAASGLGAPHLLALALAGLVESDARFGALYAALNPLPDEHRLTVGLLSDVMQTTNAAEDLAGWKVAAELLRRDLLAADQRERPRASWPLRAPGSVWDACQGERPAHPVEGMRFHEPGVFVTPEELAEMFPADLAARLVRAPGLLADGAMGGLVLRGMRGSGRLAALGSVARASGHGVLVVEGPNPASVAERCALLGPLATLLGALPVIQLELGPGETATLPPLAGYAGPIGVILGQDGAVQGVHAEACVTLRIPPARIEARRAQWKRVLTGAENGSRQIIEQISARYHLTVGGIEQAGRLAQAYAALDGRAHVQPADVQQACRALNRQSLDALATRIEAGGAWDDLIVTEETRAELMNLAMRCRQREAVLSHLGRGFGNANRGVRALFSGPSGTGKTLAARILVAELGLDLYRVDLAAVVNKYIGETERNLSRLFARAEELDVALLLDEGDALLTSRTDVRSANDRYANLETNYLLQRLESYEGILLVTTNAVNRIDSAFQRRMDVHVTFDAPNPAQRYAIWQLHLPAGHAVDDSFLRTAATRCNFNGGQIRNTALHATVLAVDRGVQVDAALLAEAVAREYRKLGAASPLGRDLIAP